MPLAPGTRLGPVRNRPPLGAAWMGEVYRARDTRLDRSVAIKVLAPEIAADSVLHSRFEREARAVAALDHPHICGIYDIGEIDDTHFLVTPCLDGQTLAARLEKGTLPMREALTVARDIADALDKAHRHGIVHRDLKPAHIMLTKMGAKLLLERNSAAGRAPLDRPDRSIDKKDRRRRRLYRLSVARPRTRVSRYRAPPNGRRCPMCGWWTFREAPNRVLRRTL